MISKGFTNFNNNSISYACECHCKYKEDPIEAARCNHFEIVKLIMQNSKIDWNYCIDCNYGISYPEGYFK
jgi:hypothetical protein